MSVGALLVVAVAPADMSYRERQRLAQDTIPRTIFVEEGQVVQRKMSHSVHPVQLHVVGSSVRVQSTEPQILPIYTDNGAFYLIVRLNKGTNWLNGLPEGRYFINGRLITIKLRKDLPSLHKY